MSLRTCSWLLPQNEQRYGTLVLLLPPVVLNRFPRLPVADPPGWIAGSGLRLLLLLLRLRRRGFRRFGDAGTLAAGEPGVVGRCDQRRPLEVVDRVDDAIVLRLVGTHEPVALGVSSHFLEWLARVASENLVVQRNERLPLLHLDDRVLGGAAEPARTLVDHDPGVRQRIALALRPGREQHRRHRRRLADADRADRGAQVLHRVVDREARGYDAARRVHVQAD